MKLFNINLHFIYVGLIVCLLLGLLYVSSQSKEINKHTNMMTEKVHRFDEYFKLLKYREKMTFENNGIKIRPDLSVNESGKDIKLQQVIMQNSVPKLIIKTSALSCDLCLEEEMKHISKYVSKIGIDNIIVIASGYNIRSTLILKNKLNIDFRLFQLNTIGIPFEDKNHNLFTFVLDNDLVVKEFFIPEKTLHELSKNYYETICGKYW